MTRRDYALIASAIAGAACAGPVGHVAEAVADALPPQTQDLIGSGSLRPAFRLLLLIGGGVAGECSPN